MTADRAKAWDEGYIQANVDLRVRGKGADNPYRVGDRHLDLSDSEELTEAEIFIQWKGTRACMDWHCPCGSADEMYKFHVDGYFAYALKCPDCQTVWKLPTEFKLERVPGDYEGVTLERVTPETEFSAGEWAAR